MAAPCARSAGHWDLALTHDLLATMLGVRRPTVTLVLNELAEAGIISTSRGSVRIVDRAKLEGRACDCYRRVSEVYDAQCGAGVETRGQRVDLVTLSPLQI